MLCYVRQIIARQKTKTGKTGTGHTGSLVQSVVMIMKLSTMGANNGRSLSRFI